MQTRVGASDRLVASRSLRLVSFDEFHLDAAKRLLTRGSQPISITPKAFDVLLALVANRDRALSKQELLDTVWPGVSVEEGALNQQVSLLRRALGDVGERRQFVQTVPRYGFRFIGEINTEPASHATSEIRTLAVMPLVDLSPRVCGDYFAEALTEALVSTLGMIRAVRVLGRVSTLKFQESRPSIGEVARTLGVDGIVEGSICRSGTRLRADVRLLDGTTGFQRWGQTYERNAADVLIVQREIAQAVATEMRATITGTELRVLSSGPRVNQAAHDACLRGYHHLNRLTPKEFRTAQTWFLRAVERDSSYAYAHAGLAHWYAEAALSGMIPLARGILKGKEAASRALDCDPASANGFAAMGRMAFLELRLARATAYMENAVRLDPQNERNCRSLAVYSMLQGHTQEAVHAAQHAVETDPLSPGAHVNLSIVYYVSGHQDLALRCVEEALSLDAHRPQSEYQLGLVLIEMRDFDKASEALRRAKKLLQPEMHPSVVSALAHVRARQGHIDEAERVLSLLKQLLAKDKTTGLEIAVVQLALNRIDDAMTSLEATVARRVPVVLSFAVDPMLATIRHTRRFQALLEHVASLAAS